MELKSGIRNDEVVFLAALRHGSRGARLDWPEEEPSLALP
jgi:hypothetical protein